jgi:endonuclease YncB( thermonuclease family)
MIAAMGTRGWDETQKKSTPGPNPQNGKLRKSNIIESAPGRILLDKKSIRVIDGDTIEVELPGMPNPMGDTTYSIRLWGCDAPELTADDPAEQLAAHKSKQFLEKQTHRADKVELEIKGVDKYGSRYDGIFWGDDKNINAKSVKAGHSTPWDGKSEKPKWQEWSGQKAKPKKKSNGSSQLGFNRQADNYNPMDFQRLDNRKPRGKHPDNYYDYGNDEPDSLPPWLSE